MRVFITGSTGSIGSRLTQALVARGDEVVGLVRSDASAARLRAWGAVPIRGSIEDPSRWVEEASRAEAIVRASAVPFAKRSGSAWLERATRTTTRELETLLAAAERGGARALIHTSGWFVAGDHGAAWIDESSPSRPLALGGYHLAGEALVASAARRGVPALSLRPGIVYAPEGNFANAILSEAERGRFKYFGRGENFLPFVSVEDLVDAYLLALDKPPVGQALYLVDDDPIPMREFVHMVVDAFGRRAGGMPLWLAQAIVGRPLPEMFAASYRIRNARAKQMLGWTPRDPSLRARLPEIVRLYREKKRARRVEA